MLRAPFLYSPNWSFGLARCFAPCSSWRLGCGPCYQGPLPYSTVYGGPVGFPIDKPPSISWLSFKGRVVVDLIRVLLEVKSWDGLLWFFFWLMCTFAEKSALSECSPWASVVWHKKLEGLSVLMSSEFFSFECSKCNFCKKMHSLSVAPKPLVFWYKKLEGQKIKNVLFCGGYLQPSSLLRVLFFQKEIGWRVLMCCRLL